MRDTEFTMTPAPLTKSGTGVILDHSGQPGQMRPGWMYQRLKVVGLGLGLRLGLLRLGQGALVVNVVMLPLPPLSVFTLA